ncbi:response regulator transcription factor [Flavobacterium sp. RHBU_3]|uniref:response regulator transcription factor n=1 Tax=Flavobacterium sp. RHBU_3 TaxID=3391184 RepID=UPI00398472FC
MDDIKVLYVEDELMLGKVTTDVLTRNGFSVRWFHDGAKALEGFVPHQFDICVVDIMLPGIDGYSLVKEFRKTDPDVPVIFLTARSLTEDVLKGYDSGGNDYLKKPFSIEELMIRMKELLKRHNKTAVNTEEPASPGAVEIAGLHYNYETMELERDGKKILLTHLENELLHRLITHKNKILERHQVLMELWGDDTFFNARSMDVFITRIRKHFAGIESVSLVNIRGIGYKFIVK